ncbi:MAG: cytochrome-c oxidase, cbb3-type subunit II [Rhodospirillales bacterium]|jgi:cytochrome c oxidase cbb3-type subunit II|nr:cytochrome-c oxidase, cbb3-type subunit II [Rhodospirillales bacterium]
MNFKILERNVIVLIVAILITVSIGGLVQLIPLYTMEVTIEKVEGMRPYTPLELAGRNIYVREGCYLCHSQQVRPFRDEVERYGHYSLAAESMYDHPFQWGSKRTGPDLSRVGGKYSNEWHVGHLVGPRDLVPETVMPAYPFMLERDLDFGDIALHMDTLRAVGVPYTAEQITHAFEDVKNQANGEEFDPDALLERYAKVPIGDFDGDPERITEMDALVAYLQMLGTLVDFTAFKPELSHR